MAECAGDSKRAVPVGRKDASQMHTFIQDTEQKGHQPFLLKKNKEFHRSSQKTGGTTNREQTKLAGAPGGTGAPHAGRCPSTFVYHRCL